MVKSTPSTLSRNVHNLAIDNLQNRRMSMLLAWNAHEICDYPVVFVAVSVYHI